MLKICFELFNKLLLLLLLKRLKGHVANERSCDYLYAISVGLEPD